MENKITAVRWLEEELAKNLKHIVEKANYVLMESLFEQAKQMEKEQIMKAIERYYPYHGVKAAEQYYNEIYGKE